MTNVPFYAAEVVISKPGVSTIGYTYGLGTHALGTLALAADAPAGTDTLRASDSGYRTREADAGGLQVYPALLDSAFQIDRRLNLDPAVPTGSAAWGTLNLANPDNRYDSLAAAWNADGRGAKIYWGTKTDENFDGPATTRSTIGTYIDSTGALATAAIGVVRTDYSTGNPVQLNEPAGKNWLPNPRAEGMIAGSPGTAPNSWANAYGFGLTRTIVGVGTEGGVPYIEIRYNGTSTAAGYTYFDFTPWNIPTTQNDNWTLSAFLRLTAGSWSNINAMQLQMFGGNSVPSQVDFTGLTISYPTSAALSTQRYKVSGAFVNSAVVVALARYIIGFATGLAIDFTVRIGAPQMEKTTAASSVILPPALSPGTSTRAADNLYFARGYLVDPAYASLSLVFAGVATPWYLTDTELQIPIRDATYWLDRPVQSNLYTGGGSYGGDATLAGLPLPKARGGTSGNPIRNVTPVLIDATNRIYQYTDAAGTVVALYEGGDTNITFSANTTNLYAGSTPAGQYRTDNSRGLFQLGSTPARTITVDCTGQFPIAGVQTTAATIARYLLSEDLLLPSGNLETASFTSVDGAYPYTSGVYFDPASPVTGLDALALLLSALGAKIIPLRSGQLRLLALRALPVSPTTVDAFNLTNIVRIAPAPLPAILAPPPYRFRVGYQHNFTVQTSGLSPNVTMAKLAFLAAADRLAAASSSTILGSYNRPNDPPIIATALQSQTDAASLATALVALWSTRRRIYDVTLPVLNGLVREIGDVVSLTYPMDDLSTGKSGQIVGEQFNASDSSITFQVLV